jgi:hypothetical protein
MCISGRQILHLGMLSFSGVTRWRGWSARQRLSWLSNLLSALVGWRCTCSFPTPMSLQIRCSGIVPRKTAGCVMLTKHCRVSGNCSLHLGIPRHLNTARRLLSDLGGWLLNEIIYCLNCVARKFFFGHFGQIQLQARVGLF